MARGLAAGGRRPPTSAAAIFSRRRADPGKALPARAAGEPETMSVTRFGGGDRQEAGARARRAPAPAAGATAQQEKVLAEISHELGNFFHKLYYWSDRLQERRARRPADATATEMLDRTIRNLEGYLKFALEYFHPIQLVCLHMPVPELLGGLLVQLRSQLNGTPVQVRDDVLPHDLAVLVDPGRLSQAVAIVGRHLGQHANGESAVRVAVEHIVRAEEGLEIALVVENPDAAAGLLQSTLSGVEWAVAEQIVTLHGGELAEHEGDRGERHVTVFLPLARI